MKYKCTFNSKEYTIDSNDSTEARRKAAKLYKQDIYCQASASELADLFHIHRIKDEPPNN